MEWHSTRVTEISCPEKPSPETRSLAPGVISGVSHQGRAGECLLVRISQLIVVPTRSLLIVGFQLLDSLN